MNKKVIIWVSVAIVLVGGSVGTYLWWTNRPTDEEDTDNDTDDKYVDNTTTTTTNSPIDTIPKPNPTNFDLVKAYFGSKAKDYQDRIVIKLRDSDVDENWGIGNSKVTIVYYNNNRFFISIEGIDGSIMSGNYSEGGKSLVVTGGKAKWEANKGLSIKTTDPVSSIKKAVSV